MPYDAFKKGDAASIEEQFNDYLKHTISIRDTSTKKAKKENLPTGKATTKGLTIPNPSVCFYHGILLGLLSYEDNWIVASNSESGDGYSDILIEYEAADIGIVIEIKYAENKALDAACTEALRQIQDLRYEEKLQLAGMNMILKYGIACYKKQCKVVLSSTK